ncbi:MAG TPA: 50S ribosomal protein L35 [Candidatus Paceibacterota bacterium]|jgi:ribosomal protein L35|nr:50S ribosomal protein L35 [Parcubacteria group bacterium]HOM33163.1 50S ribosomal protein L35 [Candidatus Paceibacterota bacterium]HPC37278.1 50S ribosomal protein L35 [Candidatus Paceibacterota bacterium]HRU35735.1 50S ribosomal protein L35 [Candidatus Paceibacterota bacterium]
MLKTKKSVQKRIKTTTKGKKLLHRPIKQNHFKSKLSGRNNQDKRKSKMINKVDKKAIKAFLPYEK